VVLRVWPQIVLRSGKSEEWKSSQERKSKTESSERLPEPIVRHLPAFVFAHSRFINLVVRSKRLAACEQAQANVRAEHRVPSDRPAKPALKSVRVPKTIAPNDAARGSVKVEMRKIGFFPPKRSYREFAALRIFRQHGQVNGNRRVVG